MKRTLYILAMLLPTLTLAQPVAPVPNYTCCAGTAFTIKIPVKLRGYTVEYEWYRDNELIAGTRATLPPGVNAIAYTVPAELAYGDSVIFYFKYRLNDGHLNAWTTSPRYMVTFPFLPPVVSEISGSATVCSGSTLTYAVENEPSVYYDWLLPAGWAITKGQGTHSITVTAGSVGGDIVVTPQNGCGIGFPAELITTANQASTLALTSSSTTLWQTVCQNSPIADIAYTRGGSASSASVVWTPNLPAWLSSVDSSGVIKIRGTPVVAGQFFYTITTAGNTAPCPAATASNGIQVQPISTLTLTSASGTDIQTACPNTPIANITYTRSGNTSSSIAWTPRAPAGISYSDVNGTITISGAPTVAGEFTYTITTAGQATVCAVATATGKITSAIVDGGGITTTTCESGLTSGGEISVSVAPPTSCLSPLSSGGVISVAPAE